MRRLWLTAACASAALAAGCGTMPDRKAEAPPLPTGWEDAEIKADPQALTDWWKGFEDPTLDRMVAEGLAEGPSARLAALRLRAARALSSRTASDFLPQFTGQASGSYTRVVDGPDLTGSFQSFVTGGGSGALTTEREQFIGSYGPQVVWEIPLWGRLEASAIGSRANTRAAVEDLRGARAALAADIAQAYVEYRAGQQRLAALEEGAALAEQLAGIVQIGADAGFSSPADAADARRLAEATRSQTPDAVIAARRAAATLATLRGRAPGTEPEDLRAVLQAPGAVPAYALAIAAPAAPADLLRLRPDVARAEAETVVAAARLGIARQDLLPQLRLTGGLDVTDNIIGSAVPERLAQVSAAPTISIPLFDWGRRFAASRERSAELDQSLVSYQSTVNTAVSEASLALTSLRQGEVRLKSARAAEAAAETTARGVRASYGAGIASLSDRIRAEQQLLDARVSRISAEQAQASAAIQVYRAFGGGPPPLSVKEQREAAQIRGRS
ncbi:MAG: TolC family protein [Hyphomonadaceae bacterium]|nr:TolC family protein [Hyphomonadaceae bacterium]